MSNFSTSIGKLGLSTSIAKFRKLLTPLNEVPVVNRLQALDEFIPFYLTLYSIAGKNEGAKKLESFFDFLRHFNECGYVFFVQ